MPSPLGYSTDILAELEAARPTPLDRVYGVELECEPREDRRQASQARLVTSLAGPVGDWYILKSDGSLDNGVEIVSLPLTLADHADGRWSTLLRPVAALAMSGARTTRCGIHVHANRSNMSALTLGKILVFINHPSHVSFVEKIAQRSANGYCRRYDKKLSDGARTGTERYQAVNVTRHTVEFRLFRGSIRPDRVMKNVEFVDAVIHFAEAASIADIGRDTSATSPGAIALFTRYVAARKYLYPNLHGFMVESGLITQEAV